ncbi:MAG: hypothetical protein ACOZBW_02380, partial [Thermodesulfobacteriota bacterium]
MKGSIHYRKDAGWWFVLWYDPATQKGEKIVWYKNLIKSICFMSSIPMHFRHNLLKLFRVVFEKTIPKLSQMLKHPPQYAGSISG